jgi:hypothetical protein
LATSAGECVRAAYCATVESPRLGPAFLVAVGVMLLNS